jgi:hypothetical protein
MKTRSLCRHCLQNVWTLAAGLKSQYDDKLQITASSDFCYENRQVDSSKRKPAMPICNLTSNNFKCPLKQVSAIVQTA